MKWQEVYFDIMSAVGHALRGSMSVSDSQMISAGYKLRLTFG